ncbi:protein SAR DEFICIENT 1-like isoform X2 [Zingiber officinale]|uniref:protein SAR DEFICIENT 1-like isoform X2 n=1 Tax=Zingiber officinale TaxID=94328 RepID=UPI001C4CA94A|nr:protein SAR DEFICIENT 1-like isoform X2 [Zingiber officinale]
MKAKSPWEASNGDQDEEGDEFSTDTQHTMSWPEVEEFMKNYEQKLEKFFRLEEEEVIKKLRERRMIRLGMGLQRYMGPFPMDTEATGSSSNLKLDFNNRFPETIYTLTNIEDINHDPLQIIVADANNVDARPLLTNNLRSPKVELLVFEGDFDSNDGNWSNQEFECKMVKPRPGKRPLLVGETTAYLSDGSVAFPKVFFTDNSSWDKIGKFRIGARVVPGSYEGPRIKEAFTEPFRVKDRRGRAYEKHNPPALCDDVWRLEKIGNKFRSNLASHNIKTVQDFLKLLFIDEPKLRSIVGRRISDQTWATITNHAKKCVTGNELYLHRGDQLNVVVVNSVCQVEKIIVPDGRVFTPNELSSKQDRDLVKHLAREAYENWDRMEEYHEPPPNADIPLQPNAEMAQGAMDSSLFDFGQDCYFPFPSPFGGPMDPLP